MSKLKNIKHIILTLFIFFIILAILFTMTSIVHLILNNRKINHELNKNKEYYDRVELVGQYKDFDHTPVVRFKNLGDWSMNPHRIILGHDYFINRSNVSWNDIKQDDKVIYIKVKDVWNNRERIVIKRIK